MFTKAMLIYSCTLLSQQAKYKLAALVTSYEQSDLIKKSGLAS